MPQCDGCGYRVTTEEKFDQWGSPEQGGIIIDIYECLKCSDVTALFVSNYTLVT